MSHRSNPTRRGLTTLELMLALAITAVVAIAISGMLAAVSQGVVSRQDNRAIMVRVHAAQSRLAAYINPSRCLLDATATDLVIWLDDARESGTVHATEIRWLRYDATDGAIDVFWVHFPDAWTQVAKDLADLEYAPAQDWNAVFDYYQSNGWMLSLRLVDGLEWAVVSIDQGTALESRQVQFDLATQTHDQPLVQRVTSTIAIHQPPL